MSTAPMNAMSGYPSQNTLISIKDKNPQSIPLRSQRILEIARQINNHATNVESRLLRNDIDKSPPAPSQPDPDHIQWTLEAIENILNDTFHSLDRSISALS